MSNVILVTGVMGSGKTLKVVADLVEDLEINEKRSIEEKRTYYADITGLKISGIEKSPYDWRQTPDYSYIIYDEAQLNPMFKRTWGKSHQIVQELTLARKRGHKIIFITQAPNRLHQDILDVVGEHYHLHRPYGAKLATCYMWRNEVATKPLSRTALAKVENKFLFNYPKKCYDLYETAQVADDGFKIKIPFKTLLLVLLPIGLFGYSAWAFLGDNTQSMVKGKAKENQNLEQQENTLSMVKELTPKIETSIVLPMDKETPVIIQTPTKEQLEDTRVAFVYIDKGECVAGNSRGYKFINLSQEECKRYMRKETMMMPTFTPIPEPQQETIPSILENN